MCVCVCVCVRGRPQPSLTCGSQVGGDLISARGVEDVRVVVDVVVGRRGRVVVGAHHAVVRVGGHVHLLHLLRDGVGLDGGHVLRLVHRVLIHGQGTKGGLSLQTETHTHTLKMYICTAYMTK